MKYLFILLSVPVLMGIQDETEVEKEGFAALDKCVDKYLNLSKYSMDVEYSVFYNSNSFDNPSEKETGKLIKYKSNFYQEELGNTKVLNDKYVLFINEQSKFISISKRESFEIPNPFEIDSLKKQVSQIKKIKGGYTFVMKTGSVSKMDFLITQNGLLHTMRTHYREKMDLGEGKISVVSQLKYFNFKINPEVSKTYFDMNSFVSIQKNGTVLPKPKYKDYYIINHLIQPTK